MWIQVGSVLRKHAVGYTPDCILGEADSSHSAPTPTCSRARQVPTVTWAPGAPRARVVCSKILCTVMRALLSMVQRDVRVPVQAQYCTLTGAGYVQCATAEPINKTLLHRAWLGGVPRSFRPALRTRGVVVKNAVVHRVVANRRIRLQVRPLGDVNPDGAAICFWRGVVEEPVTTSVGATWVADMSQSKASQSWES